MRTTRRKVIAAIGAAPLAAAMPVIAQQTPVAKVLSETDKILALGEAWDSINGGERVAMSPRQRKMLRAWMDQLELAEFYRKFPLTPKARASIAEANARPFMIAMDAALALVTGRFPDFDPETSYWVATKDFMLDYYQHGICYTNEALTDEQLSKPRLYPRYIKNSLVHEVRGRDSVADLFCGKAHLVHIERVGPRENTANGLKNATYSWKVGEFHPEALFNPIWISV